MLTLLIFVVVLVVVVPLVSVDAGCRAGGEESAGAGRAELAARSVAERMAQKAEGIGGAQRDGHAGDIDRAGQIDAELLGDVAVHLGDADLQHHLLAAGDAQHVDDLLGIAGEAGRQIGGAGGFLAPKRRCPTEPHCRSSPKP